jgi:hypothetical protein
MHSLYDFVNKIMTNIINKDTFINYTVDQNNG